MSRSNTKESFDVTTPRTSGRRLLFWLPGLVLVAIFLAAYMPMSRKYQRLSQELEQTQQELRLQRIQLTLANAALDAQTGSFDSARAGATNFFTVVSAEFSRGIASVLPEDLFYDIQPMLDERDDLVDSLGRRDPKSADQLAEAYISFRNAVSSLTPGGKPGAANGSSEEASE